WTASTFQREICLPRLTGSSMAKAQADGSVSPLGLHRWCCRVLQKMCISCNSRAEQTGSRSTIPLAKIARSSILMPNVIEDRRMSMAKVTLQVSSIVLSAIAICGMAEESAPALTKIENLDQYQILMADHAGAA